MNLGSDLNCYVDTGLVEIRPVDTGCVVIKGVAAAQYLCMEGTGRLYASVRATTFDP